MNKPSKPRVRLNPVSAKQLAKRKAAGESFLRSSVRPTQSQNAHQRKPIAKIGKQKAKRQARNREYYASAEWRAKRKAVFERDGYRCTEDVTVELGEWGMRGYVVTKQIEMRCPNHGEVVNGKQAARGLVCEEISYGHRGNPDRIDTCTTRCKACDRRLTPLERANHAHGFNNQRGRSA